MAFSRSYTKTRELEELAERDPDMAEKVEKLCRAVIALRGSAIVMEANGSLSYSANALLPFIVMQDAFDAAMLLKSDPAQASAAGSKPKRRGR